MFKKISENMNDIRRFGPTIMLRHVGRLRRDKLTRINVNGHKIFVRAGDSDIAAVRQVFGDREYDTGHLEKPSSILETHYNSILSSGRRPVIIDAGANIGTATIWFKNKYPKAAIVAIEPDPENFSVLSMNTKHLTDVYPIQAAIGCKQGFVNLVGYGLGWSIQTERASSGVPLVTVRDAISRVPGGTPFIAKIDIEGFEKDLFSENLEWIDEIKAIVIELHEWIIPGSSSSFKQAMTGKSFEEFNLGENIFYIR
jgi:FkbM family methyltransferase